MSNRRLISAIRVVLPDDIGQYESLWKRIQALAETSGAHAWRFRSDGQSDRFIEFLEFAVDPRENDTFRSVLEELDEISPAQVEEWHDSTPTDSEEGT